MTRPALLRRLLAALCRLPVVLALAAMGMLPPGVMPGHDGSGAGALVICSGEGPVSLVFDPLTNSYKPALPEGDGKPGCGWSMMHTASALPVPLALPEPAFATRRAAPAQAVTLWRPAHDPRGIWARGPPAFG